VPWEVPYLPIDPKDVGRSYESVVRVNSQSGKGGIAHVLKSSYGLDLPRAMRVELARIVQQVTDSNGSELTAQQIRKIFDEEYLQCERPRLLVKEYQAVTDGPRTRLEALVVHDDGRQNLLTGSGEDLGQALAAALGAGGLAIELAELTYHQVTDHVGTRTAAYAQIQLDGKTLHGAALDSHQQTALLHSVLSAVNRAR